MAAACEECRGLYTTGNKGKEVEVRDDDGNVVDTKRVGVIKAVDCGACSARGPQASEDPTPDPAVD